MLIKPISPLQADARALIELSTACMSALYPDDLCHLVDAESLAKPNAHFVGAFTEDTLVGIGGIILRQHDLSYGEIKRVFIHKKSRGKGLAKSIMAALESFITQQNLHIVRLETGIKQATAIQLYSSIGYKKRAPYGDYHTDPLSLFMEKDLRTEV